uniref:Phosphotransferase n=1 Tax=Romanomermis culicivorax TaxID=13658 RepID=A0A915KKX4_ROMCU
MRFELQWLLRSEGEVFITCNVYANFSVAEKEIDVKIAALLNDTVGTLMSMAHSDPACRIGIIVGTGTNACYVEKLSNCPKLSDYQKYEDDEMVINVEWGAFGDNGALDFILTAFDEMIDKRSINPGQQRFEKAISGMYLGELVRLVLVDLYKNAGLFQNDPENAKSLLRQHSFLTKYVSIIEKDNLEHSEEFPKTRKVLATYFNITKISKVECEVIARTGRALVRRSANMCAAAVVTLINRMNLPMVNIGCDGSVYKLHPTYKTFLESKIEDLLDSITNRFTLKLSEDGSGRGAALVAAVASTPHKPRRRKKVSKAGKKDHMSAATKRLAAELEKASSAVSSMSSSEHSSVSSSLRSTRDDRSEKRSSAAGGPVNASATAQCKIS